jgi:hypothetical protein
MHFLQKNIHEKKFFSDGILSISCENFFKNEF